MNTQPVADLDGLTPDQAQGMMLDPFAVSEMVLFHPQRIKPGDTPVMRLFTGIAEVCGEKGLKATASGFLPRKLVRSLLEDLAGEGAFWKPGKYWAAGENEFSVLIMTRHCATFSGLIRRFRGKFMLTRKARIMLERSDYGSIFYNLFRAASAKWNWGSTDGFPELYTIQSTWLVSLRWLHLFGDRSRDEYSFYGKRFLKAFPDILNYIPKGFCSRDPEKLVKRAYGLRMFERFALAFGLAEREGWPQDMFTSSLDHEKMIRKTPLLDKFIEFQV